MKNYNPSQTYRTKMGGTGQAIVRWLLFSEGT